MRKGTAVGIPAIAATLTTSLLAAHAPAGVRSAATDKTTNDPCSRPWLGWPGLSPGLAGTPSGSSKSAGSGSAGSKSTASGAAGSATQGSQQPQNASSSSSPGSSGKRPNVVMIMVDDMRQDEISGPWMQRTRNLIKNQGATFRNSFSPSPLCGPARASFFSGRYAHNTGVRANQDPASSFEQFDDRNTLPVWLRKAGYNTAHIGKYLNGYGKDGVSAPDGSPSAGYVPPGWNQWNGSLDLSTYNYRGTRISDNGDGKINLSGRYQTSAYGDIGSQLISRMSAKQRPFFLNMSFTAPHTGGPQESDDPEIGTPARRPETRGAYDDQIRKPRGSAGEPCNNDKPQVISGRKPLSPADEGEVVDSLRQRAESLQTVDKAVARLFRSLRRSGELANTYVIFTSDNGFFQGEHRHKLGKKLPYEPSLRTPTLMRGPGIDPGIVRQQDFTTMDFAPTIADMANAKVRAQVDGASRLPSATGSDRGWTRPIFTDAGYWKDKKEFGFGVRMPGFAYHRFDDENTDEELFDLSEDRGQNHNVVDEPRYRKTRRVMERALDRLRGCAGAECRRQF